MKIITDFKRLGKAGKIVFGVLAALCFITAVIFLIGFFSSYGIQGRGFYGFYYGYDYFWLGLSFCFALLGILFLFFPKIYNAVLKRLCSLISLEITNDKIIGTYGSFFKKSLTMPIEQLDNIVILDGISDKIRSGKTLMVTSANGRIRFPFVQNADEFSEYSFNVIKQYKTNYGKETVSANSVTSATNSDSTSDYTDELLKLNDLLNKGIITQEEFDAKKKQILGL